MPDEDTFHPFNFDPELFRFPDIPKDSLYQIFRKRIEARRRLEITSEQGHRRIANLYTDDMETGPSGSQANYHHLRREYKRQPNHIAT